MSHPRYICIHGHFYQPPRENPWLGVVEVQDSASPFHDWNERITHESYAPNARARLLDDQGRIINILNNYAWMSFNFGPTLLNWMAGSAPDVLDKIVEADRVSRERRGGHGNALAQAFNHMILPLATARDKKTQVMWGVEDFRRRFGRDPEGMWLAETAVDVASLEALAEAGIKFTVLAPSQARRWRKLGEKSWTEEQGGVDPSRAYLQRLPSGRSIALFFYDGIISQQVAFERLLDRGEKFLSRLFGGFDEGRNHAQLMHIATDGESYGHHHAHGDMALAYVLERLSRDADVRVTNYGEFLELHPPAWEVEIHEDSSWSCAHGVERWRSDCGCKTRGDWHQKWRAPLRAALDGLKKHLDHLFSTRGRVCFRDPWAARNGYIQVLLSDYDPETTRKFLKEFGHPDLDEQQTTDALRLLEIQLDSMLMYTSCGWFFDELSGLETTQCLQYAARAIALARHFGRELEEDFVSALAKAPSNLAEYGDGRGVWEKCVRPAVVDLDRVLAHHAISLIYRNGEGEERNEDAQSYSVEADDVAIRARGAGHLAVGRLVGRSRRTWVKSESHFVVVHFGGLDFHTVLCRDLDAERFASFRAELLTTYRAGSLADVLTLLNRDFAGVSHRLDDLFRDEQRRIIGIVLADRFEDYRRTFTRLANQDEEVLNRLGRLDYPIPKPMRAAALTFLDANLHEQIDAMIEGDESRLLEIEHLCERGRAWGYTPQRDVLGKVLSEGLKRHLRALGGGTAAAVVRVERLLDAAAIIGITPDLWEAQNEFLDAFVGLADSGEIDEVLSQTFRRLAVRLEVAPTVLGWRP